MRILLFTTGQNLVKYQCVHPQLIMQQQKWQVQVLWFACY